MVKDENAGACGSNEFNLALNQAVTLVTLVTLTVTKRMAMAAILVMGQVSGEGRAGDPQGGGPLELGLTSGESAYWTVRYSIAASYPRNV